MKVIEILFDPESRPLIRLGSTTFVQCKLTGEVWDTAKPKPVYARVMIPGFGEAMSIVWRDWNLSSSTNGKVEGGR